MTIVSQATRVFVLSALFMAFVQAPQTPALAQQRQIPQSQEQVWLSFAPLVERAAPAVVNIYARKIVQRQARLGWPFNDQTFRNLFGDSFSPSVPRRRVENSLGSGVIVRPNGLIVTNHHVIKGATEIRVVLNDRREFDAAMVLSDERTDLAILRIDTAGERLTALDLANSDSVKVGDLVLAIGNPFGVGQTVTSGIVSGLARTTVGISDYNFFIQTDAAINPGNSGGALIGLDGRLIGVNTAIFSRRKDGGSIGIGFAVPTNMVRTVIDGALSGGKIQRPWIGMSTQPVTQDIAQSLGLRRPTGVLIKRLHPQGPAMDAGLRHGDVVLTVNGREIVDPEAMRFLLATERIGSPVQIGILRGGRRRTIVVVLRAPPEAPPRNATDIGGNNPLSGAAVANLSPAFSEEIGVDSTLTGVIVFRMRRPSIAHRLGLKPGDIILAINDRPVRRVADLKQFLSAQPSTWLVRFRRGDKVDVIRARG